MRLFIIGCFILLGVGSSKAQLNVQNISLLKIENIDFIKGLKSVNLFETKSNLTSSIINLQNKNTPLYSSKLTTPSYYCYDDLALFCKIEVKLEKTAKFPVKFRLGDVNEVERLEGKNYTPNLDKY